MELIGVLIVIVIVLSGPIALVWTIRQSRDIESLRQAVARLSALKTRTSPSPTFEAAPAPEPQRWDSEPRAEEPAPLVVAPLQGEPLAQAAPSPPRVEEAPPRVTPPRGRDWEQWIGGAVLNRIGIALVVLGITFALGYTFHRLGAPGKAALSTVTSLALLLFGCFLERKPHYRFQARGLIAGGWAALFVTAYAIHGLPATRIIDDPRLGFVVLIGVAAGMIVHSLTYRTQAVTSIAYSLAYSAIVIHSVELYTVAAATLLGVGSLLHLVRRRWYFLAISGIVSTYGSVLLWYLRQEYIDSEQRYIALAAIGIDWLVFLAADFSSRDLTVTPAWKPRLVALLNGSSAVMLGTLVWSLYSAERLYVPAFVIGCAYVLTATLSRIQKRDVVAGAHTLLATLALGYAAWLRFDLRDAAWIWLAEAEIAMLLGLAFDDARLRRFGVVFFLAPLAGIVIHDGGARMHQVDGAYDSGSLLFTTVATLCFYHAFAQQRRFAESKKSALDIALASFTSWAGGLLVVLTLWIQLPIYALAPSTLLFSLLLLGVGRRFELSDLRLQTHIAAAYAILVALGVLVNRTTLVHGVVVAIPSSIATSILLFTLVVALGRGRGDSRSGFGFTKLLYSSAATILLSSIVSIHARDELVGPYFVAIALVLLEVGIAFSESAIRGAAYAFSIFCCVALGEQSISSTLEYHGYPSRLLTTLPSLVILYSMWWRVRQLEAAGRDRADVFDRFMGRALSYFSLATLLHLLTVIYPNGGALVPESVVLVALFGAGTVLRDADLRLQGYLLALFLLTASLGDDFERLPAFRNIDGTVAFTFAGLTAFLLCGGLVRVHQKRLSTEPDLRTLAVESLVARFGADALHLGAAALTFIYLARTRSGFSLSVAFAIEGLVVTAAGFAISSRALRVGGLAILGIALAITIERAFTTFDTIGRIVSFLVLGGILLAISLGYARIRGNARRDAEEIKSESTNDEPV